MSISDPRFLARLNLIQEELLNEGDFPGVVDRWFLSFDGTTGEVALPYTLDRLMQVTVDGIPREMRSPWYEFVQYGPGNIRDYGEYGDETQWRYNWWPRGWIDVVVDRGDSPVMTYIPKINGPWYLRVYGTVAETTGITMNLQGEYDNLPVRTYSDGSGVWYNGEDVEIENGTYHQTTNYFDRVTAAIKPETNGTVLLKAWNGTTEVPLAEYAFNQTTCTFRRYYIPAIYRCDSDENPRIILGRCRRRFVPVANDDDVLIISNVPALEAMIIAQWKRESGNLSEYFAYKQIAVDLLNKEATSYLGKAKVPSFSFQRGFALGTTPWIK